MIFAQNEIANLYFGHNIISLTVFGQQFMKM
jgi:hypothetical protein